MRLHGVARKSDHFDTSPLELGDNLRHHSQLRGAHGCEVSRMREQDPPTGEQWRVDGIHTATCFTSSPVPEPIVEFDRALGGVGRKVGEDVSKI